MNTSANAAPPPRPVLGEAPRHVAIIMDGNGRWATRRGLPRNAGHRAGVKAARRVVEACVQRELEYLTLFAFSSENWKRPRREVALLMTLFVEALQREVEELHRNSVQLRFIGDRAALRAPLRRMMQDGEQLTRGNTGLKLVIAVAYGGRWDLTQAARQLAREARAGAIDPRDIDEAALANRLALGQIPDPDLFIRTGGEHRISNFLLWSLAYSELYFSEVLWPDFDDLALAQAFDFFTSRQRRFGRTEAQVESG